MSIHKVKKYKIIKNDEDNKMQVQKTKEEWDKETCNGTKIYYFYSRYKNSEGKIKQFRSKLFELERDAKAEEALFLCDPINYIMGTKKGFKATIKTDIKKHTIEEMWQIYLKNSKSKESTTYSYESNFNCHIKPYFNELGKYIEDITKQDIKNWKIYINTLTQPNGKKYTLSYKQKNYTILKNIFETAVDDEEFIEINVVDLVKNFEDTDEDVYDENDIRYQTLSEYYEFIDCVDNILWKSFFSFTFWQGMREGEEQALTWNDIDLKKEKVKINKTLTTKIRNGGYKITNTKNRKNRIIPIAPEAKKYLLELYSYYSSLEGFNENWFVFGGIRFLPMTTMRRQLKKYYDILEKKKGKSINRLTHHEFGRHSCASYLKNNGADIDDVAEFLGDSPKTIEKTYYHSYKDLRMERIKKIW